MNTRLEGRSSRARRSLARRGPLLGALLVATWFLAACDRGAERSFPWFAEQRDEAAGAAALVRVSLVAEDVGAQAPSPEPLRVELFRDSESTCEPGGLAPGLRAGRVRRLDADVLPRLGPLLVELLAVSPGTAERRTVAVSHGRSWRIHCEWSDGRSASRELALRDPRDVLIRAAILAEAAAIDWR